MVYGDMPRTRHGHDTKVQSYHCCQLSYGNNQFFGEYVQECTLTIKIIHIMILLIPNRDETRPKAWAHRVDFFLLLLILFSDVLFSWPQAHLHYNFYFKKKGAMKEIEFDVSNSTGYTSMRITSTRVQVGQRPTN
ncbi:hypothetical protein TNCV_3302121 [Trichonephila clavipes]|nr:hypothetical protein TNCV_3302121 [Trichonephila clavipes]